MKSSLVPGFRIAFVFVLAGLLAPSRSAAIDIIVANNGEGNGSLRQAIQFNASLGGGNTILFSNSVTGTITLTGGQLLISNNVTIIGPGAKVLTVSGNNASRVFRVTADAAVSISGLTIARGWAGAPGGGGILQDSGTLTLANCTLATNYAVLSSLTDNGGGGIHQTAGTLALTNCTIYGSYVQYGRGGGINQQGGTLTLHNSTISGNTILGDAGGGIYQTSGTMALTNCTISGNGNPGISGGGIHKAGGAATVRNTIIAGNAASQYPDCVGSFTSAGFNLIGVGNGSFGWSGLGDQLGTTISPVNAQLGPLQDHGGPTLTMVPSRTSPAIDLGNTAGTATDQRGRSRPYTNNPSLTTPFSGDHGDIGAVEISPVSLIVLNTNDSGVGSLRQMILGASPVDADSVTFAANVTNTIRLTSGELAIQHDLNIVGPGANLLAVSGNNSSRVFEILSGNVSISGLTIRDGRVQGSTGSFEQNGFEARGGGIFNQTTLAISDCVISNNAVVGGPGGATESGFAGGGGNGLGGGIANIATLNMTNCTIVSNSASGGLGGVATSGGSDGMGGQGYGGGIYTFGTSPLVSCTVNNNNAAAGAGNGGVGSASGGGIYNDLSLALFNCTIVSNTAGGSLFDFGGGIFHNGTSLIARSATIFGNQSDYGGGLSGSADCGNTILAGNSAPGAGPDCSGTIQSSDYNLIQNTNDCTLMGTITHNIIGQNPMLGPLTDNGGPTRTMSPRPGSPAIDKGKSLGLTTDQRGAPRPFDFAPIANASGGDGSDIGAFESGSPHLNIQKVGSSALISWPWHYGGFTLQLTTNAAVSNSWTTAAGVPLIVGSQYQQTNGPVSEKKFFRLKGN